MLTWLQANPGAVAVVLLAILASVALVTVRSIEFVHEVSTHSAHKRDANGKKEVALVIAHPDDESMFFLPSILSLQDSVNFHLLCLSTGDFDGLGATRKKELLDVWAYLNKDPSKITILDDPKFKDGMKAIWTEQDVAASVLKYAEDHTIDTILTFDEYGISGHPNHISVHNGVKHAINNVVPSHSSLKNLHAYVLDSTSLWRKYLGVLDIFFVTPSSTATVSLSPWINYQAMALHYSQFVWFRRLFVVFSRYTFINTFTPLHHQQTSMENPSKKKSQ